MIKQYINKWLVIGGVGIATMLSSCTKDLDRVPFYDQTSASVYNDFGNYKAILAKLYAGYAISGQQGPAGKPDLTGIDEGFSNYIRQYWQAQELPTDEAVIAWNDGTLPDYHRMTWTSANEFIKATYDRIFYEIAVCNEFIRETTDDKLGSHGISGTDLEEAKHFRAEARFLRALAYWHALDLFGNVPFSTENDQVSASFFPPQTSRANLFSYIESELLAIEPDLVEARQNEYGRADKAAAWMLLAKLYLNAEVYAQQQKYTETITYCNKIIGAGYTLSDQYRKLFLADNNTSPEMIFTITYDGIRTKTYGGMTYLVHAPVGGSMNAATFGINGGWAGLRTTKTFVNLFADPSGNTDKRAMFYSPGQSLEINDVFTFTDGYAIAKFRNVTVTGAQGSDKTGDFPDTDYPMFRLADAYLMYAEAVLRGGTGGSAATALQYVNQLRQRAYGNASGNITSGQLTLDFILAERGRELHWEGHRRTDLIRFGKFTSATYLWPWKGNVKEGRGVEDFRTLYPIPAADRTANPNLNQNTGY
ncbi:RagB/SusD family nutrient uptake outer membrane protein [Chitinophaga agrisoli]|uniref:RagB/SusD family nutrient uptake outer membrane protein n=1 Tax=Chitinophaga agrisoli TaxID=2607653 RepID=A0A5B2VMF7_9BACT|nr:RagB/SusD family nutrient uptake outer membrane protein [Chitinophaga agrisoli]KAA2240014.1 RagB/SusD family nutrient uptake outer membrane protein [Chitinophaga agrisoli]